jgi:uncharacterized membrane protein YpjA
MTVNDRLSLSYFWSKPFLGSRFMLWTLLVINLPGTVYGYMWYWQQLVYTWETKPHWLVIYVPDSPTASLFFTISLFYLLADSYRRDGKYRASWLRSVIESVGAVALIKYGIWAASIIAAGAVQGEPIVWQDGMLSIGHLGMAAEALLYLAFFRPSAVSLSIAAIWVISNDFIDYGIGIYPWLPDTVADDLNAVSLFTFALSLASVLTIVIPYLKRKTGSV